MAIVHVRHYGDFAPGTTAISGDFSNIDATATGFALSSSPALAVYKDNSTTESTSGVSLTSGFDSRTGRYYWVVDTSSDGTFYSAGSYFAVFLSAGTSGTASMVGQTVGSFTLNKVAALRPTEPGRTLDVTTTGAAGIDWANVENPTTALALTATTIATTQQVDLNTIKTQVVTCGAGVTIRADVGAAAAPGAANGMLIGGSNAATTFATLTSSGLVSFHSLTVSNGTVFTGAVSMSAGLAITQSTVNGNGLTITGNGTGAGVLTTGGASGNGFHARGGATVGFGMYAEAVASGETGFKTVGGTNGIGAWFLGNGNGHGLAAGSNGGTGSGLLAYNSAGSGGGLVADGPGGDFVGDITGTLAAVTNLTNLPTAPTDWITAAAVSAAAVTEIQNGLATPTNITAGTLTNVTNLTNLPTAPTDWIAAAAVSAAAVTKIQAGLSTYAGGDTSGTTTLLARITAARAGYFDNLNVGGPVASQADIASLSQSASRTLILQTVPQYELPGSGTVGYTVEARTFDPATGDPVNADSTPTLAATGSVSGNLSANLSAATNPATGVYRWTYTVAAAATQEQILLGISATITAVAYTMTALTQTLDLVSATWTTADAARLTAVFDKLPSKAFLTGTADSAGNVEASAMTGNFPGSVASVVAGVTVTTNNDKSGYTLAVTPPTAAQIAAVILATPANLLVTDGSGRVTVGSNADKSGYSISGTLTTLDGFNTALNAAHGAGSWATAVGFAVPGSEMTLTVAYDAAKTAATQASVNALPSNASITAAVAAQIITDHGAGLYNATGGLDAAGVRAAIGLAAADLDTQLSNIQTPVTWVRNYLGGDRVIDTGNPAQWKEVVYEAGTVTVITRRDIKSVTGTPIINVTTVVGQAIGV